MAHSREMREKARNLRHQGWTVGSIAKELNVRRETISRWVFDIELTDEQIASIVRENPQWIAGSRGSQANRLNALNKRIEFQQEGRQKAQEYDLLHVMGCILYWGEGAKNRNSLYFVNSDENMLLLYMRFLREQLDVPNEAIRLHITCHSNDDQEKQRIGQYWCRLLELSETAIEKVHTKKGANIKKGYLQNGVCGIRVSKTKLTMHIFGAIQEYAGFDNPDWLF